jgi:putative glycosyl hydrolase
VNRRRAVAAVVAAAVVAVILALASGNGSDGSGGSSQTIQQPANRPTAPAKKQSHKKQSHKAGPKRHRRQGVRRGHGTQPDEPAPGTGPLLAIADQKTATFSDPLFRSVGVARTRLNTPWNSIFTEPARLDGWLAAARADGIEPLVAFEHARGEACPAQPCRLPSVAEYTRAVGAFHQRYPWVRLLQPWNEANSATQPTGTQPERAASYYEALRSVCHTCIVPAADVADGGNMERWLGRFRAALHGPAPRLWGLHNYTDTNRFRSSGTQRMLAAVPGEIWLTETGGIVSFTTADGRNVLPYNEQRAAAALRYLFRLARLSRRITRIYIYQWKIDFPGNRFDAGLVRTDNKARPSLRVLLQKRPLLR